MGNTKSISILLKKDEQTILQYLYSLPVQIGAQHHPNTHCLRLDNLLGCDKYGNTPLMILANRRMETAAIMILFRYKHDIYHRNKKRESVLSISCKLGLKKLALDLLNNFNYKKWRVEDFLNERSECFFIDNYGRTPLSYACASIEMEEVALRLIEKNAGLDSGMDATPLIIACENKNIRVAKELIKLISPAVINHIGVNGENALSISCRLGLSDVALDIINTKCLSSLQHNNLALLDACKNSMEEVAIALIKSGKCYLECKDHVQFTPLHYACKNELENVVNELVERLII